MRTPTNGAAFPATTFDRPYLTEFSVRDTWKNTKRNSFAGSADFKVTPRDRLSLSLQYGSFDVYIIGRVLQFNFGRVLPGDFASRFTHGASGAGNVTLTTNGREANSYNYMPTLKWYHEGPQWRGEAGFGHGRAYTRFQGESIGMFSVTNVRRTGVTVSFDEIDAARPAAISVADGASGAVVDPYALASYTVNTATLNHLQVDDQRRTAYANVKRDFAGRLPFTLKGGLDVRQSRHDARDNSGGAYAFVGADGRPLRGPTGAILPLTTDPLAAARLTMIERGAHRTKEYLRFFPSINASYNLRENLILRAAHYYSIGRPNYNQYTGGINLPDTDLGPLPTNRISVNNVGIKAWSARTTKVRLEHYFERVGLLSVGAFRRDFENFFGATVLDATPEFLAQYGLDPAVYGDYEVSTNHNLQGVVRMEGLEFGYNWFAARQALDVKGGYSLSNRWAVFFNLQNVTNEPVFISEIAGPTTPAYARTVRHFEFPALWTFGLKGNF